MTNANIDKCKSIVEQIERRYDVTLLTSLAELRQKPWLLPGRTVIVIDTFRNSTAITCALAAGAADVVLYPKGEASVAQLRADARSYTGPKLLAGEFEGHAIPGFDLSNSPLDFGAEIVHGRRIFYSSTNGAAAVQEVVRHSTDGVYLGCMLNAHAVGKAIAENTIPLPIVFVCAGFRGGYADEDILTAAQIMVIAKSLGTDLGVADDAASAAFDRAPKWFDEWGQVRDYRALVAHLSTCRCGSVLAEMGQAADIRAAVSGDGIDPCVLEAVRGCIPMVDRTSALLRIIDQGGREEAVAGTPGYKSA